MNQLDPQQLPESGGPASSLKTHRDFRWADGLASLADPSLDPLFWRDWWKQVSSRHFVPSFLPRDFGRADALQR